MRRFKVPDYQRYGPNIQVIPLIDVALFSLMFFMVLATITSRQETELNIAVPQSKEAKELTRDQTALVINITREGKFVVNRREFGPEELEGMLKRLVAAFPNQAVIIRADGDSYHKFVIEALDVCARARIEDISFAAINEGPS